MNHQYIVPVAKASFAGKLISPRNCGDQSLRSRFHAMCRERALSVVSLAALMLLGVSCVPAHAQTLEPNWIQQSPATSLSERYF